MWERILEGFTESAAEQLSPARRGVALWRRILEDGGLLLAMLLTSSWLVRG
jgi:hypothetical protein